MNDGTAVAVADLGNQELIPAGDVTSTTTLVLDDHSLDRMLRLADIMAMGVATIPKHLQKNRADCLAVTMQAMQWRMNPFAVAQKTHVVNGTLGYEAQLVIAVINSRAPISDRLRFTWDGDWSKAKSKDCKEPTLTATASATLKGDTEPTKLTISMAQIGTRNSPLWADDPKQQLAYVAAKRWARLHCPDVILGVYTPDELDERPIRDVTPPRTPGEIGAAARPAVVETEERAKLIAKLETVMREKGVEALQEEWGKKLTKEDRISVGPEELARIKAMKPEPQTNVGPTAAELLDVLDIATNPSEVSKIGQDAAGLSDADREAVESACLAKLEALKAGSNG